MRIPCTAVMCISPGSLCTPTITYDNSNDTEKAGRCPPEVNRLHIFSKPDRLFALHSHLYSFSIVQELPA